MKAVVVLIGTCLLAGLVSADYAWETGMQYKYKIRGRIMTGISEIDNQYAGLQVEYEQTVIPRQDGVINLKTRYLRVLEVENEKLARGWMETPINRDHELTINNKFRAYLTSPMDITMKKGVVQSIKVQGDLPTWAVNMKRAMASVWTLDTVGSQSLLEGNLNRKTQSRNPQEANQEAGFFFETIEETVHGECETYYTVSQNGPFDSPYQFQQDVDADSNEKDNKESQQDNHTQGSSSSSSSSSESNSRSNSSSSSSSSSESSEQGNQSNRRTKASSSSSSESNSRSNSRSGSHSSSSSSSSESNESSEMPWPRAFKKLCQHNDQMYEIIKAVNFSACNKKPVLAHTSPSQINYRPGDNAGGSLWQHGLVSRYLVCGSSRRNYTILKVNQQQRFYTGLQDLEKVVAGAQKNVTLVSIKPDSSTPREIQNPLTFRNLVYVFSNESQFYSEDKPVIPNNRNLTSEEECVENCKIGCAEGRKLPKPKITDPPTPSLVITKLDIKGVKSRINELMKIIVNDLTKPTDRAGDSIANREVLSKISTVVKALRVLKSKHVNELAEQWVRAGSGKQEVGRSVFLDALAIAGTNPTANYLLQKIKAGHLKGEEAAQILSSLPIYIQTPIKELLEEYFSLIESENLSQKEHEQVRTTAMLSFSSLVYDACINKGIKNSRYPVALYGEFCDEQYAAKKFVPFFINKLEQRIASSHDTKQAKHWIVTLLTSLGNLGHPDTIQVVQKILDHESCPLIKVKAVTALRRLIKSRSTLNEQSKTNGEVTPIDRQSTDILTDEVVEKKVLPVLVAVTFDRGEHPEVRNAALELLFHCSYADVAIWQQVALSTWFEQSRNVRSFIYSSIKGFAQLERPINHVGWAEQRKARAVLPLLKNIDASILRSHNIHNADVVEGINSGFAQHLQYVQPHDSLIPNHIHYKKIFNIGNDASTVTPVDVSVAGSIVKKLVSAFVKAVRTEESTKDMEPHGDIASIKSELNIKQREQSHPILGALKINLLDDIQRLFTFDPQSLTLENMQKSALSILGSGRRLNFNYQKTVHLAENKQTMPSIMGIPLEYHTTMPALITINATVKSNKIPHQDSNDIAIQADVSAVVAGKVHRRLAFKCPLTGKKFQAGVQRHFVIEAPLSVIARKTANDAFQLAITPTHLASNPTKGTVDLITYHQRPYTTVIRDEFWPASYSEGGKFRVVHANRDQKGNEEYKGYNSTRSFGLNTAGLAFSLREESDYAKEEETISGWARFVRQFHSASCIFNAGFVGSPSIRFVNRTVVLDMGKSDTKTVHLIVARKISHVYLDQKLNNEGNDSENADLSTSQLQQGQGYTKQQEPQLNSARIERRNPKFSLVDTARESSRKINRLGARGQQVGTQLYIAILGRKLPLAPLANLGVSIQKQRPLQATSTKTIQYLLQAGHNPLRHDAEGEISLKLSSGASCHGAIKGDDATIPLSAGINEVIQHIRQKFESTQASGCAKLFGTLSTPNKAIRFNVAISRRNLLKMTDLAVRLEAEILAGAECSKMNYVVNIEGKLRRDEEMTEWARNKSPEAQKCKQDEKKGFEISQICMEVSEQQAAALNEITLKINHSQLPIQVKNVTHKVENVLKALFIQHLDQNNYPHNPTEKDTIEIKARISPNKQFIQAQIRKPDAVLRFNNITTNRFLKTILPLTSSQTIYGNVKDRLLRSQSDPMCAIQNNWVNTFDNVTYSFHKGVAKQCQHVLVQDCSGKYPMTVLVNNLHQKEGRVVTVLLGDKNKIEFHPTNTQTVNMPSRSRNEYNNEDSSDRESDLSMRVLVNGEEKTVPYRIRSKDGGKEKIPLAEIVQMPNGGVQLVARRFQVATDGERVIVYVDNEFRNRTCGICGDFDNEKVAEMRSPQDVPLSSGTLLVASYALEKSVNGSNNCRVNSKVKEAIKKEEAQYNGGKFSRISNKAIRTKAPRIDAPETDAPDTEGPNTEAPDSNESETEAPDTESRETEAPDSEEPETEAPDTESRETEAPDSEEPETEAPDTESPDTEAPTEQPPTKEPPSKESRVFQQRIFTHPQNKKLVCFSKDKLPKCNKGYMAKKMVQQVYEFFCLDQDSNTDKMKADIEAGEFLNFVDQDLTQLRVSIPTKCDLKPSSESDSGEDGTSSSDNSDLPYNMEKRQLALPYPTDSFKICFTQKKFIKCKTGYQPKATESKKVQAYCLNRSQQSLDIMDKIHSNEFVEFLSNDLQSIDIAIPTSCRPR